MKMQNSCCTGCPKVVAMQPLRKQTVAFFFTSVAGRRNNRFIIVSRASSS